MAGALTVWPAEATNPGAGRSAAAATGRLLTAILVCLTVMVLCGVSEAVRADDRHAGYYYPQPDAIEVYVARADQLPGASPNRRTGFVTAIAAGSIERPYPPSFIMFAKGARMEKLIITTTQDGLFNTKYRLRAMLAQLTSIARTTPIFQDYPPEDRLTFFDLAYMMGFEQITYTNGVDYAHQVKLLAPGSDPDIARQELGITSAAEAVD